jgi:hypothetical protein
VCVCVCVCEPNCFFQEDQWSSGTYVVAMSTQEPFFIGHASEMEALGAAHSTLWDGWLRGTLQVEMSSYGLLMLCYHGKIQVKSPTKVAFIGLLTSWQDSAGTVLCRVVPVLKKPQGDVPRLPFIPEVVGPPMQQMVVYVGLTYAEAFVGMSWFLIANELSIRLPQEAAFRELPGDDTDVLIARHKVFHGRLTLPKVLARMQEWNRDGDAMTLQVILTIYGFQWMLQNQLLTIVYEGAEAKFRFWSRLYRRLEFQGRLVCSIRDPMTSQEADFQMLERQ